jgi:hypothetical protein
MDIFSLIRSAPGLANMAGQGVEAVRRGGAALFQEPEEDEEDDRRARMQENALRQQSQRSAPRQQKPINDMYQGFMQQYGPAAQARSLQGMANTTMDAIAAENTARRSSFREARRLAHERDMLLLRLQAEREGR